LLWKHNQEDSCHYYVGTFNFWCQICKYNIRRFTECPCRLDCEYSGMLLKKNVKMLISPMTANLTRNMDVWLGHIYKSKSLKGEIPISRGKRYFHTVLTLLNTFLISVILRKLNFKWLPRFIRNLWSLHHILPAAFLEGCLPQVCHLLCSEASGVQSYLPRNPKHDCSQAALSNNVVSHGNACQQIIKITHIIHIRITIKDNRTSYYIYCKTGMFQHLNIIFRGIFNLL
jgi:hypothetical protein